MRIKNTFPLRRLSLSISAILLLPTFIFATSQPHHAEQQESIRLRSEVEGKDVDTQRKIFQTTLVTLYDAANVRILDAGETGRLDHICENALEELEDKFKQEHPSEGYPTLSKMKEKYPEEYKAIVETQKQKNNLHALRICFKQHPDGTAKVGSYESDPEVAVWIDEKLKIRKIIYEGLVNAFEKYGVDRTLMIDKNGLDLWGSYYDSP